LEKYAVVDVTVVRCNQWHRGFPDVVICGTAKELKIKDNSDRVVIGIADKWSTQ